jgi:hypothetical protein
MLNTIQREIFKVDGTIFGGYVVDTIIHNHYAEAFYKAKEEYYKQCDQEAAEATETTSDAAEAMDLSDVSGGEVPQEPICVVKSMDFAYCNKKSHPESWPHRVWQPEDVDFVIHPSKLDTLILNLKKAGLECVKVYSTRASFYIPSVETENMKHNKYTVYMKIPHNFAKFVCAPCIQIDVILDPKYEPGKTVIPYGQYDFECNRITLTKFGYNICTVEHPMRKIEEIQRIIQDIVHFRAVPKNAASYRMVRMLSKGFTIKTKAFEAFRGRIDNKIDGRCLHCLDDFEPMDYTIKNNCCEARYHIKCYPLTQKTRAECQYNNVDFCALCRTAIPK